VLTIALFHVLAAGYDQFSANVLLGQGAWHQWSRDVAFMVVDALHVVMATRWLCHLVGNVSHESVVSRDELLLVVVSVALLFILSLAT